jgi:putative membrane protein
LLWLKALHIVFVVTWFAGLFYLPRLFVYHAQVDDEAAHDRFVTMERRLLAITHIGGVLALAFGSALLAWWIAHAPGYFKQGWLHAKLALVLGVVAYHVYCVKLAADFRRRRNRRSERWLRLFNEVPAVALVGIVILVVVKPF